MYMLAGAGVHLAGVEGQHEPRVLRPHVGALPCVWWRHGASQLPPLICE